jgi:hypothetical protein
MRGGVQTRLSITSKSTCFTLHETLNMIVGFDGCTEYIHVCSVWPAVFFSCRVWFGLPMRPLTEIKQPPLPGGAVAAAAAAPSSTCWRRSRRDRGLK